MPEIIAEVPAGAIPLVHQSLDAVPENVRTARVMVSRALDGGIHPDHLATLELLTTEVVANAVGACAAPLVLDVSRDDHDVVVAVTDASPRLPSMGTTGDPYAERGRGLLLVDALADRWGTVPVASAGKVVWFSLAT